MNSKDLLLFYCQKKSLKKSMNLIKKISSIFYNDHIRAHAKESHTLFPMLTYELHHVCYEAG